MGRERRGCVVCVLCVCAMHVCAMCVLCRVVCVLRVCIVCCMSVVMCHLESFLSLGVVWEVRQSLRPAKWVSRVGVPRPLCPRGDAVPDGDCPTPFVSR